MTTATTAAEYEMRRFPVGRSFARTLRLRALATADPSIAVMFQLLARRSEETPGECWFGEHTRDWIRTTLVLTSDEEAAAQLAALAGAYDQTRETYEVAA